MTRPRLVTYPSYGYNPYETQVDLRVRCSVCGFAGIDPVRTSEPEQAVFTTVKTGTVYQIPVGTPADQLAMNLDSFTQVGSRSGCPFCGSPDWAFGSAPDLQW